MRARPLGWLGVMFLIVHVGVIGGSAQSPLSPTSATTSPLAPQIYVTDFGNNQIVRMDDMTGAGWTALGSQGDGTNQFHEPRGIFVDASGRIYVVDTWNDAIVRMNDMMGGGWHRIGAHFSLLSGGPFHSPQGIAVDKARNIYVADTACVMRLDSAMNLSSCLMLRFSLFNSLYGARETPEPVLPGGLSLDPTDRIYLTDPSKHRIIRMDNMGAAGWTTLGSKGVGICQFNEPRGITIDPAGHIYVADAGNNRIVRIDEMTGAGWTSLGTQGNAANQFDSPTGIAVDASGRVYLADPGNQRIVRVDDMAGAGWVSFGTQGNGVNQFDRPFGIYVR